MTWVKLDDQFPSHPKMVLAGGDAAWLHVCALCYCGQHLTDGKFPKAIVGRLENNDAAPPAEPMESIESIRYRMTHGAAPQPEAVHIVVNVPTADEPRVASDGTTARPWFIEGHTAMDRYRSRIILMVGDSDQDRADLALVVEAVNAYPAPPDGEVERLRTALVGIRALNYASGDQVQIGTAILAIIDAALSGSTTRREERACECPTQVVTYHDEQRPFVDAPTEPEGTMC
jgi:hypothetical protein